MESFEDLKSLIDIVQKYGQDNKVFNDMKKAIADSQFYFRGHYRYELKWSSECQDHCLFWSLSDPDDANYSTKCDHEHNVTCFHCTNLRHIIGCLIGLLEAFKSDLGQITFDDQLFSVSKAYKKILPLLNVTLFSQT